MVVRPGEVFTLKELMKARANLKTDIAKGLEGVPNEVLRKIIEVYSGRLLETLNTCLEEGVFLSDWKKQKQVLLREGHKPLNETSFYRTICLLDSMGNLLKG